MQQTEEAEVIIVQQYPSLVVRVQSIMIDTVIIIATILIISGILNNFENTPDWIRGVLFFILFTVYEPLATTLGGTFGNRLMKIQVRKAVDHVRNLNILQAYIRFFVKFTFGWLSFITIHMNKERRAIHDLASGSVMMYRKR